MGGFDEVVEMVLSLLARRSLNILIGIVLIVVVIVCVEKLLVILAGLHFAAIALFAKREIKVVAFEADPVVRIGLLTRRRVRKSLV